MAVVIQFPVWKHQSNSAEPRPGHAGRAEILRFPGVAEFVQGERAGRGENPAPASAPAAPRAGGGEDRAKAHRNAMLAKIHIALNGRRGQPGLFGTLEGFHDSVYRFCLEERYGVDSAAALDNRQLDGLLKWLSSLGFKARAARRPGRGHWGTADLLEKINALLAEKGKKDVGGWVGFEYAESILSKQTKNAAGGPVADIYQATPRQLMAVIAALDKDGKRKRAARSQRNEKKANG